MPPTPPPPGPRRVARYLGRRAWKEARAHRLAYAGGLLLVLSGSVGSAATLVRLTEDTGAVLPGELAPLVEGMRHALATLASLGGTAVLIGGYLAEHGKPRWMASLPMGLGSGASLLGVALWVASGPDLAGAPDLLADASGAMAAAGVALAVAAQARLVARGLVQA